MKAAAAYLGNRLREPSSWTAIALALPLLNAPGIGGFGHAVVLVGIIGGIVLPDNARK